MSLTWLAIVELIKFEVPLEAVTALSNTLPCVENKRLLRTCIFTVQFRVNGHQVRVEPMLPILLDLQDA